MTRFVKVLPFLALVLHVSGPAQAVEDTDWDVTYQNRQQLTDALSLEVSEMFEMLILFGGRAYFYEDDLTPGTDQQLETATTCTETIEAGLDSLDTVVEAQFAVTKQSLRTTYGACWDTLELLEEELGSTTPYALETALEGGFSAKATVKSLWSAYAEEISAEADDIKFAVALEPEAVRTAMASFLQGLTDSVAQMKAVSVKIDGAVTEAQWEEVEAELGAAWFQADSVLIGTYDAYLGQDEDEDEDDLE